MISAIRISASLLLIIAASSASAIDYPAPSEGDYTIRDFKFTSGETLPELRLHYRTLGKPEKIAGRRATLCSSCMERRVAEGIYPPEFAGELSGKISRSMRRSFSSCYRTRLVMANRVSQAMACTPNSRVGIH
jgi:hypothetical protein